LQRRARYISQRSVQASSGLTHSSCCCLCCSLVTDRDGRLTGPDAVRFFERSGLPRELLAKVWANSDNRRQGFLDFNSFVRALELVSLAQVGVPVNG
jgi:hypothetical protein